ncbi:hypothetical protein Hypma_006609 [Hypsizygus marmoreus]|uniref:Uncharacterized protein n=1 Tax=Hypsizygus marmoreus TaxID=39966 RepID=A0A369JTZ4_HYPMA|nr:hypothetical protein Hypma_006609 [Hypsizygus marmoreus]
MFPKYHAGATAATDQPADYRHLAWSTRGGIPIFRLSGNSVPRFTSPTTLVFVLGTPRRFSRAIYLTDT